MIIRYDPKWEFKKVEAITNPKTGNRFYLTPYGDFPSMTTVLSANKEKQAGLERWRNSIGRDKADAITRRAGIRGTQIHKMIEEWLPEGKIDASKHTPGAIELFGMFTRELTTHMECYNASEVQVYSKLMGIAGSTDLFGVWDGKLSIIDFKTARKPKRKEWITDYFLQTTGYAMMIQEMHDIEVPQIVVLVAPDHENECQVFVESPQNYKRQLAKAVLNYKLENRS